jgi:UDP-N-acetylmuramoylalanine--D-glutamate ligase
VPGAHNLANLCGAVAGAMLLLGGPPRPGAVQAAVDAFGGLPSRCRTVGERDGREFVDDALASNPFATTASLGAFPGRELTVILGGADRGTDPGILLEALAARRPVPRVVVLGTAADAAARRLLDGGSALEAPDVAGAVALAVSVTPPGGVVLFSPAAPTPAGGGGYRARSREFVSAAGLGETAGDTDSGG